MDLLRILLILVILYLIIKELNIKPQKAEFLKSSDCSKATVEDCIKNSNDVDNSIDFSKFSSVCKTKCTELLKNEKESLYGADAKNHPRYGRYCPKIITNMNYCLRNPRSSKINSSKEADTLKKRDRYCKGTCSDWYDEQIKILETDETEYESKFVKIVHFKPTPPSGMTRYYENLMTKDELQNFIEISQDYMKKLVGKELNIEKDSNGNYEVIEITSNKNPGLFYGEFTNISGALSDSLKLSIHNYFINELGGNYKRPEVKMGNYDPNGLYIFFIEGVNNHMYTNSTCGYAELIGENSIENVNDKFQNIYRHPLDRNPQGALFVHMFLKGRNGECSNKFNYKKDEMSYLHHVFLHETLHAMGVTRPTFKCTNVDESGNYTYDSTCETDMKKSKSPEHTGHVHGGTSQRYNLMYSDATGYGSWLASIKPNEITMNEKYKNLFSMSNDEFKKVSKENAFVMNGNTKLDLPEYNVYSCNTSPGNNASIHPRCYFI